MSIDILEQRKGRTMPINMPLDDVPISLPRKAPKPMGVPYGLHLRVYFLFPLLVMPVVWVPGSRNCDAEPGYVGLQRVDLVAKFREVPMMPCLLLGVDCTMWV